MEILLFLIGGRLYTWLELACRGRTHWTMFILGGLCFVIIGLLNEHLFPWDLALMQQAVIGAVIITVLEFLRDASSTCGLAGMYGIIPACRLT